jgi:hypothetical protein
VREGDPKLFTDVVVVIPGILGSTLRRDGKEVWGLSAGSLSRAIATLGRDVKRLQLPDDIGDHAPDDGVTAGALMPDLHVIPGIWTVTVGYDTLCSHLIDRFRLTAPDPRHPEQPANVVPFAYDWRLSNRYNAACLKRAADEALERWRRQPGCQSAGLFLICHSMGGLIARYYLDVLGGAADAKALITLGTPHRGAANAVDALVNGVRKGLGPLSANLSSLARSLPSLYQLLPEYACMHTPSGLVKTTATEVLAALPREVNTDLVRDAMAFHQELDDAYPAEDSNYRFVPVIGTDQPTFTTCQLADRRAVLDRMIGGDDEKGDGTVPRFAARPKSMAGNSTALHHSVNVHGHLPAAQGVLDEIDGALTANPVERLAPSAAIGVTVDDVVLAGDPIDIEAEWEETGKLLQAQIVTGHQDELVATGTLKKVTGLKRRITLGPLPPGDYRLKVGRRNVRGELLDPITVPLAVLDPAMLTVDSV